MCIDDLRARITTAQVGPADHAATWQEAGLVLQRDGEIKLLQARIEWLQDARKMMRSILDRSAGTQRA